MTAIDPSPVHPIGPIGGAPCPIGTLPPGGGSTHLVFLGQGAVSDGLGLLESVLAVSGILVVVILVGGVIAMFVRRRLRGGDQAPTIGFTLEDLRLMQVRGEITLEEFENARGIMLGKVRGIDEPAQTVTRSRVSGRIPPPRSNPGDTGPNQGH